MAYAPQTANPGSRGQDSRYDTRNTWWDPARQLFTDGTYHYREQGPNVLSEDRPSVSVEGLFGADDDRSRGGGGSGGGGGGGGFVPSGVYQLDAQRAKLAYDRAVAAANTGQQNLNKNIGVTNAGGKMQIDPYNEFGMLRMLLGNVGAGINDAYDAASERHIGHRGLGAQGVSQARRLGSAQVAGLGNQYLQQFSAYEQSKQDALAEYNLAKQLAEYYANLNASWYSGGGGDPGGSYEDVARAAAGDPFIRYESGPNAGLINNTGTTMQDARNEHLDMVRRSHVQSVAKAQKKKKLPMGIQRR